MVTRYRRRLLTPWANCILNGFALVAFIALAMYPAHVGAFVVNLLNGGMK